MGRFKDLYDSIKLSYLISLAKKASLAKECGKKPLKEQCNGAGCKKKSSLAKECGKKPITKECGKKPITKECGKKPITKECDGAGCKIGRRTPIKEQITVSGISDINDGKDFFFNVDPLSQTKYAECLDQYINSCVKTAGGPTVKYNPKAASKIRKGFGGIDSFFKVKCDNGLTEVWSYNASFFPGSIDIITNQPITANQPIFNAKKYKNCYCVATTTVFDAITRAQSNDYSRLNLLSALGLGLGTKVFIFNTWISIEEAVRPSNAPTAAPSTAPVTEQRAYGRVRRLATEQRAHGRVVRGSRHLVNLNLTFFNPNIYAAALFNRYWYPGTIYSAKLLNEQFGIDINLYAYLDVNGRAWADRQNDSKFEDLADDLIQRCELDYLSIAANAVFVFLDESYVMFTDAVLDTYDQQSIHELLLISILMQKIPHYTLGSDLTWADIWYFNYLKASLRLRALLFGEGSGNDELVGKASMSKKPYCIMIRGPYGRGSDDFEDKFGPTDEVGALNYDEVLLGLPDNGNCGYLLNGSEIKAKIG